MICNYLITTKIWKTKKLDVSITPLRLSVTIGGLAFIGLNKFYMWNIPGLGYIVPIAIMMSVFLTQGKEE